MSEGSWDQTPRTSAVNLRRSEKFHNGVVLFLPALLTLFNKHYLYQVQKSRDLVRSRGNVGVYGFLSVSLKLVHSSCLFIFSGKIMPFPSLRFYVGLFVGLFYVRLYCLSFSEILPW